MSRDDDDDMPISWTGDLPPRIKENEYDAVVLSMKKVNRFGLTTVESQWRLLLPDSREKIQLSGYCNLGPTKQAKIRPQSKLVSWQRAVAAFTRGNPKDVTLKSFREFWFRVLVRTVTRNAQGPLHDRDQYSVVDDILRVCGKVSDLSADGLLTLPMTQGEPSTPTLSYPSYIPGLGPLRKDALTRCASCEAPTTFGYGGHPLCLLHARSRAHEEGQG
jgi:hypothetical protein